MSAFISASRSAFLYLSKQAELRRWMEHSPQAQRLTSRFIAGLQLEDGLRVARELRSRGIRSSLDRLGENVTTEAESRAARDAFVQALRRIAAEGLPATVSAKVTSLGLDISEDLCLENCDAVVRVAAETGSRVEFDMEDSSYTDRNLRIVREMHARHGSVRAVIQAYLYRSADDIAGLNHLGIPVRLCKGAYREPPSVAWPNKADVDRNYVTLMHTLLDQGTHPALATHDEAIAGQAFQHIASRKLTPHRFEFQMLYGVGPTLQRQVVARGYALRLYVPYGEAWYPYFMRRLAERPANVMFLARNLLDR